MPEQSLRSRWERSQRPNGAWSFETRDDGTILFFPHAWGRGYVVPTREKRREIETYLDLWLIRIRTIDRFLVRLFFLTAGVYALVIISVFAPFSRFARAIPGWYDITHWSFPAFLDVGILYLIGTSGTSVVLSFVAATAKADLAESDVRRSFVETFRNHARRSKWWRLWISEAFCLGVALTGVWLLWLSQTGMRPPHVISGLLVLAAAFLVTGALGGLVGFWQMRVKRKSEGTDPG